MEANIFKSFNSKKKMFSENREIYVSEEIK